MIIGDLEYLISSLPTLQFDPSEEASGRFQRQIEAYAGTVAEQEGLAGLLDAEAGKFLPSGKYELFRELELDRIYENRFRSSGNTLLSGFSEFNYQLRKALQRQRSPEDANMSDTAEEAPGLILPELLGNPLENEVRLLKMQWDELDELAFGHYADFTALLAYKLRLLLLIKLWSFRPVPGYRAYLETLYRVEA